MPKWEEVRRQVAIAGRVTDAVTCRPLAGAKVTISSPAISFDLITDSDGHYHALDLPAGIYTISAIFPEMGSRYGTSQAQTTVSVNSGGRIITGKADIGLPPTTLKGKVTSQNGTPAAMAEISIRGSAERTRSDSEGNYTLSGIEKGIRQAEAAAMGFKPSAGNISIDQAGSTGILDFVLEPS